MSEEIIPEEKPSKKKEQSRAVLEISQTCRNCDRVLELDQRFCQECGAKRMYNRLNWRNLFEDFIERFLNIENHFLKTFLNLFKKPDDVIVGYIQGVRKRYIPAFSYFAIAVTLSGFYAFVFKEWFMDNYIDANTFVVNPGAADFQQNVNEELFSNIMDYQSIISFIYVPILSLISIIVFWNYRRFNYVEHIVIHLYLYSQVLIVTTIGNMIFVWNPLLSAIVGILLTLCSVIYGAYVFKEVYQLSISSMILKTFLFFIVGGLIFTIFSILTVTILYKAGLMDGFVEMVKIEAERQRALKEAKNILKDSISGDSARMLIERVRDTIR